MEGREGNDARILVSLSRPMRQLFNFQSLLVHCFIGSSTYYVLCLTHYVVRFTFYASRFTFYASRFTFHVSRITFHVSRFRAFWLSGLLACAFFAGVAYSQDVNVSAEVSPKTIRLGENAILRVTISGNTQLRDIQPPNLAAVPGFRISYLDSSSRYSLMGGQISVSMTWSYQLIPQKVGKFTFPSVRIPYGSKTYRTETIPIEVIRKSQIPPQHQKPSSGESSSNVFSDAFQGTHKVEAFVDKVQPYVGEQITYTFRYLYTSRIPSLDSPTYTLPSLTRFWTRELPRKPRGIEMIDGTSYRVEEIRFALFPIITGEITIEPMQLSVPASVSMRRLKAPKILVTDSVEVNARLLPQAGQPDNFTGVVGQYQIIAQVDRQTIEAGSAITLRVRIGGTGNIERLTEPVISPNPNMTIYDPKITDSIKGVDSKIRGNRTYEYAIIPLQAGNLTIPAIKYPYFDPEGARYRVARTNPIAITVLPGQNIEAAVMQSRPSNVRMLKQDIRHIKPDTVKLRDQGVHFHKRASFWALQLLPIVAIFAIWGYQRRQAQISVSQLRGQNAAKNALKAVESAEETIENEPGRSFAALANALYQYIGDTLNISPIGLNPDSVCQYCGDAGISESATKPLVDVLKQCDYVRFAPSAAEGTDMTSILDLAKLAIQKIEKERK